MNINDNGQVLIIWKTIWRNVEHSTDVSIRDSISRGVNDSIDNLMVIERTLKRTLCNET